MPRRKDKIHKRKDGRWEGRFFKERMANGRIRYASVYGRSYYEVKNKLETALRKQSPTRFAPVKRLTLRETGKLWLEDEKAELKPSSICRYQFLLDKHIYPTFGDMRIDQITTEMIQAFAEEKKKAKGVSGKKLTQSYIGNILVVLMDVHAYAVRKGLCASLTGTVSKPSPKRKRHRILNGKEIKKLIAYLKEQQTPVMTGVLITMYTGMRIGEVCALQWADINLDDGVIFVRKTVQRVEKGEGINGSYLRLDVPKTESSLREVPLHPNLLLILKSRRTEDDRAYVLTGTHMFINPATYEYQYHKIMKNAGVADIRYHDLRHSFTTACVEGKMDIKTLSEILGHAKVNTTLDVYTHPTIGMKKKEISKIPSFS